MAFKKSLKVGNSGEEQVVKCFEKGGIKTEKNAGDNAKLIDWDLKGELPSKKTFTAECKYDVMAAKTGNLAVEHYNVKLCKPSGINATKADLWVVVLTDPTRVFATTVSKLREYCKANKPFRDIACGGDDNAAIWLYKANDILPIFVQLDAVPSTQMCEEIARLLDTPSHT